jgi:hypothetical protein
MILCAFFLLPAYLFNKILNVRNFKAASIVYLIILKYSVLIQKRKQPITIRRINCLMMFKEMIALYSENHMKPVNTLV